MDFHAFQSPFDCLLIDIDDTLYSSNTGIGKAMKQNIEDFLASKLNVSPERAFDLRVELFRSHGSSLAGLIALGYDVHPDEYHSVAHGRLPYELIQPDPQLQRIIRSIPQTKIIFTNSDIKHAKRVLERLGIEEECFAKIICFETMNEHLFVPKEEKSNVDINSQVILKPSVSAMEMAVNLTGFDPERVLFLDDNEKNVAAGKALGLQTALVGKKVKTKEADYLVDRMSNLREIIPEIWGPQQRISVTVRGDVDSIRTPSAVGA